MSNRVQIALDFNARFDGDDYNDRRDRARLVGQIKRVFDYVRDGEWRTVQQIASATGDIRVRAVEELAEGEVRWSQRGEDAHGQRSLPIQARCQ